jgi:hypothetical protein
VGRVINEIGPTEIDVGLVDRYLSSVIGAETRELMWESVESILAHGPVDEPAAQSAIGLALGYVQSGKTSSIVALIARAADKGYRVIIALLGSTNLLLEQNQTRIRVALGIDERSDYRWIVEENPRGRSGSDSISEWLARERIVLIPVLKHAGRVRGVASALAGIDLEDVPVLIIDDEADQASLNTKGRTAESTTFAAIGELRASAPRHLYVQYTATPYAPLLLEPDDRLLPEFVEFLHPGPGYVGGREFFVDYSALVVRNVPVLEEQRAKRPPSELPDSLETALSSFIAGATLLLALEPTDTPVSMLVHSTQSTTIQDHYFHLIRKTLAKWRVQASAATSVDELPGQISSERDRLVSVGAPDLIDGAFLKGVRSVLLEATPWLVNSVSEQDSVNWLQAPIHILVGGNKLDRGFTIEGLTVTYMNRPTSPQVDTMEQRARAFGYRQDQLPYCQFFATKRTVNVLRDVVFTEYDLRARLQDHMADGGDVASWAKEIGLLLPPGTRPTRPNVVQALSSGGTGWHSLRRPALSERARKHNEALVANLGLFDAPHVNYGRLRHRTLWLPLVEIIDGLAAPWETLSYSPGWRHLDILDALCRNPYQDDLVPVLLLDDGGRIRTRKWDNDLGFVNLFQGRDLQQRPGEGYYPGDRAIPSVEDDPDKVVFQVHRVERRDRSDGFEILALAVYLGQRALIRRN